MTKTNPFIKRHQEVAEKIEKIKSEGNEHAEKMLQELLLQESLEEMEVDINENFEVKEERFTRTKSEFPLSYEVFYEDEHDCVKYKFSFPVYSKDVSFYDEVLSFSFPNKVDFKTKEDSYQLEIDLKTFIKWEYRNFTETKNQLEQEKTVFSEKVLNPLQFEIDKMNSNIRAYNQSLESLIQN
ncbi:hypothetical protein [Aureivirga marina]|uniref:hypothetical protein n=1 Tax=Aureivirga marina TaxID=1182451 RepID=UPI0018CB06AE|nr:hypothetical protein [Aureivirga marina]